MYNCYVHELCERKLNLHIIVDLNLIFIEIPIDSDTLQLNAEIVNNKSSSVMSSEK